MPARISSSPTGRRSAGFTLVELLVVIILILTLATLVVAFAPRLAERQKVPRGASLVQGWLAQMKARAKRDQLPTGIRLQPDPDNPNLYRELQYIQKPDDWTGGTVQVTANNLGRVGIVSGADFRGGFTDPTLYPVQMGDYLEIKGGGLVHRINTVGNTALTLASPFPHPIQPTTDYRIIRAPRPLTGEANLDMPKDIAIQGGWGSVPAQNGTVKPFDILFSPGGPVLTTVDGGGDNGRVSPETIVLWVRDASLDLDASGRPTEGEPLLVTIYMKTGLIAVHPINPDPTGDPYQFTKDGRSSGL